MRFGRTALDLFNIDKAAIQNKSAHKDGSLSQALDYLFEPIIYGKLENNLTDKKRRLKTFIQFEMDKQIEGANTVNGECYNDRSFRDYHLAKGWKSPVKHQEK